MTVSAAYGPIVHGGQVETAAQETLRAWMATYLAELERQAGTVAGKLPVPRGFVIVNSAASPFAQQPEAGLWLWTTGTNDVALVEDGEYTAAWDLYVSVAVVAANHDRVLELSRMYAAAVRALLVQQGDLGGVASHTTWLGESYADGPANRERSEAVATVEFRVQVDRVTTWGTGPVAPIVPPDDPEPDPGDAPEIAAVNVTATFDDLT